METKLTPAEREAIKNKAENDVNAFIKQIERDHQPKIKMINTKTMEFYKKKIKEIPVLPPTEEEVKRAKAKEERQKRREKAEEEEREREEE